MNASTYGVLVMRTRGFGFIGGLLLGAILGGVAIAVLSGALPDIMSRFMENMMRKMDEGDWEPPSFCREMMERCADSE